MSTWEAVLTKAAECDHRLFLTGKKTTRDGSFFHQVTKEEYESNYGGPKESIATVHREIVPFINRINTDIHFNDPRPVFFDSVGHWTSTWR